MSGAPFIPERSSGPLRRSEQHLRAGDGTRLFRRSWLPESPHRTVLLVHGYAEHSGRYEEMASWLANRGAAVHAYDHRGHGLSGGRRAHVRAFSEFLDDLDAVLAAVREEHGGLPIDLVGHSMGGLIALGFLVDRKPSLHAAVTSGAAVAVDASPGRILLARILRGVLPTLKIGSGLDLAGLSRDPEVVQRYVDDPLVFRDMTTSLGAEMIAAAGRVAARASEVEVPLLMLHGEDDPLCAAEGSRAFAAAVPTAGSDLRIYPDLRHEIFNEPEREQVYRDLWSWLDQLSAGEPRSGAEASS